MEFRDAVKDVSKRVQVARDTAQTEEATKNGVILPFLRALGFDVFDLEQVVPEFVADVGMKKGEKVDYALKINGTVVMLVEAKPISTNLGDAHYSQLFRYFGVTDAKIAILTNGAEAWFFSDIDEANKMDKRPFFKFIFEAFDDEDLKQLTKFHRNSFSAENILQAAASLKYTNAAEAYLSAQLSDPEDDFVRVVGKQVYEGNLTKQVIDQLRQPVKTAFTKLVRDRLKERLDMALGDTETDKEETIIVNEPVSDIETTEEEWQAYHIVQAIASETVEPTRIHIRDAKSYCSVLFDDNNRKPICRLYFNAKSVKYVGFFDEARKETRHEVATPSDIFKHKQLIEKVAKSYL